MGGSPMGGGGGEPKMEVLAIVSLATGVLGLLSCCCCFALPLPIVAIVTGALGITKINGDPANLKGKELAFVGIGLGALAVLITIGLTIFQLVAGNGMGTPAWQQF